MLAPLLVMVLLGVVVLTRDFPGLLAGCIGSLAGSLAAHRGRASARAHAAPGRQAAWRVVMRAGASLFFAVAAILVVVVIPTVAKDTSPNATLSPAVKACLVSVVVHVFLAAFMLWRTRGSKLPVVPGVFGLLLGLLSLGGASAFAAGGPAMRPAAIALYLCTGIDFVVGALSLVAAAMVRERDLAETAKTHP
jgi:hypothetical protein